MIRGVVSGADVAVNLAADQVLLNEAELPLPERLVRIGAFVDGLGGVASTQRLRGVVYRDDDSLVAVGDELVIDADEGGSWRSLTFPDAGEALPADGYRYGLIAGGTGAVARVFREGAGDDRLSAADAYIDGPADPHPALAAAAGRWGFFLETHAGVFAPANVPDLYLARLPFEFAQRIFGAAGAVPESLRRVKAGWHYKPVDDEQGASAIARAAGPMADLVGQRLRVTRRIGGAEKSVYVYLHAEQVWPDDIDDEDFSLSRRAWLELAPWPLESLEVRVEVMA